MPITSNPDHIGPMHIGPMLNCEPGGNPYHQFVANRWINLRYRWGLWKTFPSSVTIWLGGRATSVNHGGEHEWNQNRYRFCGRAKKAEPPPTYDVNRDSGTTSANGGCLRRIVGRTHHMPAFSPGASSQTTCFIFLNCNNVFSTIGWQ